LPTCERGTASGQRVVLSTIVKIYKNPEEQGRGPTKSTCRCEKRRTGTGMWAAWSDTDCAGALLQGWIQRFGVPDIITSDRGPQFTSSLWASLCSLLSISHTQTTAYHPQSNGLVEHFHRRMKDALRARAAGVDWFSHLPWVLLGIRTAWREGTEFSPSEAVCFCFLALQAVPDQSGNKRPHFRPTKTSTHETPGSSYTRMMDVV
jgi:hypothetical protein